MSADKCGAECRDGTPCENYPVQGAERCRMHGGTKSEDAGAPEGNGNAITHGATADPVNLFNHLDDDEQAWVELLVDGYLDEAPFDETSPKVERLQMVCVVMYQEWAAREVTLREGPSEDTVIGVSEEGAPIARTDEHHLTGTAARHNQTVRMNLKDLGLIDDPDSQLADSANDIADVMREVLSE